MYYGGLVVLLCFLRQFLACAINLRILDKRLKIGFIQFVAKNFDDYQKKI